MILSPALKGGDGWDFLFGSIVSLEVEFALQISGRCVCLLCYAKFPTRYVFRFHIKHENTLERIYNQVNDRHTYTVTSRISIIDEKSIDCNKLHLH
jgi:hypothetical protein